MTYKFLEHTADVKFSAEGKTFEEMLVSASGALFESIKGNLKIEGKTVKSFFVSGEDYETILRNFLEEFLYFLDAENFLASKISEIKFDPESIKLSVKVIGDEASNYDFTNEVKAVTFNEMFVRKTLSKWECQVVLDV